MDGNRCSRSDSRFCHQLIHPRVLGTLGSLQMWVLNSDYPRSPSALMFSDSLSRFLYQDSSDFYLPAELILIKPFKIKLNHTVLL